MTMSCTFSSTLALYGPWNLSGLLLVHFFLVETLFSLLLFITNLYVQSMLSPIAQLLPYLHPLCLYLFLTFLEELCCLVVILLWCSFVKVILFSFFLSFVNSFQVFKALSVHSFPLLDNYFPSTSPSKMVSTH